MNYATLTKILLLSIIDIFLGTLFVLAQPALIPNDPGNNVYAITFTDVNQRIISIEFDEDIIDLGNTSGWTILVGGTPAGIIGPVFEATDHRKILFQLASSITYADRNNVYVTYNQATSTASPKLGGSSGEVASFGPIQAVNNLPLECEMWDPSRFDYSLALTEICAPAEVEYTVAYYVKNHYINSINYDKDLLTIRTYWGDGASDETYGAETSPGKFEVTFNHLYPDDPAVCYWNSYIRVGIGGIGYCDGGGLRKTFIYENHSTDDEGDGIFEMHIDTIPVCIGQDFTEIFTDATYFNCNPQTEPDFSNDGERHIRFTYGTNQSAEPRIQDILVAGIPLAAPLQGPVLQYDSIRITGVPAPGGWESSDPISHVGNLGTDAVGQVFEIMLENWGPCNPYNAGFGVPIVTYSYIKIVDGPIADAGPDMAICEGDQALMAGSILRTATAGYWDTFTGDGTWTNPASPGGAIYTPGSNDISSGGVWLVLHAEDPASGCPEHLDSMYLTIDPIPTTPVISNTGPLSVCFDGGTTSVQLQSTASPNGSYAWYQDGVLQPGFTTQLITLDQVSHTGDWYVIVFGNTANACPSTPSNTIAVEIGLPATVEAGPPATICSDQTFNTAGSFGGGASSVIWTTSGDGTFADENDPTTIYTPGNNDISAGFATLTLTTNDPSSACPLESDLMVLTIDHAPSVYAGADASSCVTENFQITDATASDYNSIAWTVESGMGNISSPGIINPTYNTNAGDVSSTVTLRLTATANGVCADLYDEMYILVDATPSASVGVDQEICDVSTAILDGNSSGSDLNNNARGEWAFANNLVFQESFTGSYDGAQDGLYWNLDLSNTIYPYGTTVHIVNDEMQAERVSDNTGYAYFETEDIDISTSGNVKASVDIRSSTTSGMEAQDFLNVYYVINGGAEIPFPVNGSQTGNFGSAVAEASGLSGNNLKIVIRFRNSANGEFYYFDNIVVRQDDGITIPTITDPSDPNSTVSGLLQGDNQFSWSVFSENGGCTPAVAVHTITRDLLPDAAAAGPDQAVCETDNLVLAGNVATDGGTGTWTVQSGAGAITTINSPTSTVTSLGYGDNVFRWTIESALGICANSWDDVTIQRNHDPIDLSGFVTITKDPVCYNTTAEFTVGSTEADVKYYLYTGGISVDGPVQGTGGNIVLISPNMTSGATYTIHAVKDVTGCEIFFGNYPIAVNPQFTLAQLQEDASICLNTDYDFRVIMTGGTAPYDIEYSATPGGNTILDDYVSGTNINSGVLAVTTEYALVSVVDDEGCPAESVGPPITIIVGAPYVSATITAGADICDGDDAEIQIVSVGGAPPYTYEITGDNAPMGEFTVYAADTTLTITGLGVGVHNYNLVTARDVCGNNAGSILNSPDGLEVVAIPVMTVTNNADPICNGDDTNIGLSSTVNGTFYEWTVIAGAGAPWIGGNAPSNGSFTEAGAGYTIAQTLQHSSASPVTVTYQITSTGPGSTACAGNTETVSVEVAPTVVVTSASSLIRCTNTPFSYTIISSTPGANFIWDRAAVVGISNPAVMGSSANPISEILVNTTNAPIDVEYIITPSILGCPGTPFTFTVTVNPTPAINNFTNTICDDGSFSITPANGSDGIVPAGTTYSWGVPVVTGGLTGGASAAGQTSISGTLNNPTNLPQTATYTVTPISGSCTGNTFTVTISVDPTPAINNLTTTICDDGSFTVIPVNGADGIVPGVTTYSWAAPVVTGGLTGGAGAAGQASISGTLSNPTNSAQTATYTVTPVSGSCSGSTFTVTVTVNPTPDINDMSANTCGGSAFSVSPIDGINGIVPAGTTYSWGIPVVTGGLSGGGAAAGQASISGTLINPTNTAQTATYTVTPVSGACTGAVFTVLVTVNPTPDINDITGAICDDATFTVTPADGADGTIPDGTTYSWGAPAVTGGITGGVPASGQATVSGTLNNPTTSTQMATYTVTPLSGTCSGATFTVTITVYPTPALSSTLTPADVCSNTSFNYNPTSGTVGTTFNWTRAEIAGITPVGPTSGVNNPGETLRNMTSSSIPVTYQYTLAANGCSNVQNVVVNIKPEPVITPNQFATACSGNALDYEIQLDNFSYPDVIFTWPQPSLNPVDPGFSGGAARVLASANNITDSYNNTTGAAGEAIYTVTPYYDGCQGDPVDVIAQIGSEPVLDPNLDDEACSQVAIGLILGEAVGSIVPDRYDITAVSFDPSLIPGGSNHDTPQNDVLADYLSGNTYSNKTGGDLDVVYTVVPKFGPDCVGDPVDVTITIHPEPVIMPGQLPSVCSKVPIDYEILLQPANTPAGTTFDWTVPVMSDLSGQGTAGSGVAADPAGSIHLTDAIQNYSGSNITATYTITPTSALSCVGQPTDVIVTIKPQPVTTPINGDDKVCAGDINLVYEVASHGGSIYTWTVDPAVGTKVFDFNTSLILMNAVTVAGTGDISVIETNSAGCQGDEVSLTVDVTEPAAPEDISGDPSVCAQSTQTYSVTDHPGSVYLWSIPPAAIIVGDPSASSITVNFGNVGGTISVTETTTAGCETMHHPIAVTINPLPRATISNGGNMCQGDDLPLQVTFTGTGPWTFVHAWNGVDQAPITTSDNPYTLIVNQAGLYTITSVTDGNSCPGTSNGAASVVITGLASITDNPEDVTICEDNTVHYSVTATGAALSYQWQESTDNGASWNNLSDGGIYVGTDAGTLTIFSVDRTMDGNLYRVLVSGSCGIPVQSVEAGLTVLTAPEILVQPLSVTVCENSPAGFGIDAQGTAITYQWMVNDGGGYRNITVAETEYSGADSDSLTLLSVQQSQNGYPFMVVVSGTCAPAASSDAVILQVEADPVITTQPASETICENGFTVFTAGASGPPGMTYRWYVDRNDGNGYVLLADDANHSGSNTEQLAISNAPLAMSGWRYQFEVSTACMPLLSNEVILTVWENPAASITPLTTHPYYPLICGGDVLTLDGSPTGGSGTYSLHQWSGDTGPLSGTDSQVVDFETEVKGQYALAYTVTDSRGCSGSGAVTIENERPTARFTSDAEPSCGYMDVTFTNTSSAEASSFLWDFDDGTTSADRDVTHGFDNTNADGQVAYYNIFLEAISDHDCRDTARSVITIYPKVEASINADPVEGCHPLNVTFLTTPGAATYYWDFGDGNAVDGSYVAYHLYENYSATTILRSVELTTTSFYGCQDTDTFEITVEPIPSPNFTASPLVQTYPDATVNFTNTTQAGPWTFEWDFGDGNTSTEENPLHTYDNPGTYTVTFYVNNGDCIDSMETSVVIHPRDPIAAFVEPNDGCTPLEVQFVNQSQWATSYLWDFGDGYVSTKENPSHTYYDAGEITVRLQANGPGGTTYATSTIHVYETPNVAFNSAPDSVFVKDKPVRFFNLTAGATYYLWDFGDYYDDGTPAPLNFSNAEDTLHIYYTEGIKNVKLVAWNDNCIDSLILPAVKVIPAGDIRFPNVFRPNQDGPTGGYVDPNDPNLDPNLANSIFYPGVNKQVEEYHLYIYNRWGELIFQSHDINVGWDGYIRGELAQQGVYLWKVILVYKNGSPESLAGDVTLLWKREN